MLVVATMCAGSLVACGSTVHAARDLTSLRQQTIVRVHRDTTRVCALRSAFVAIASASRGAVACPTWLPPQTRPTYFDNGANGPWQVWFTASAMVLDIGPASTPTPSGRIVARIELPHGNRVVVRQAGPRAMTATVTGAAGPIEMLRLQEPQRATRRLAATMTRIGESLAIVPGNVPVSGKCPYGPLFATMATLAGSRHALCPRWLPAAVSPPTGVGGYGTSVVEFYGPHAGLPHVVFDWTRAAAPPGQLATTVLSRGHRVPIYFNPGLGQALFSNHYTAVVATSPHGPSFWVSWHLYYNDRGKDLGALLHIIRSLTPA